jgi:hypothetical protein
MVEISEIIFLRIRMNSTMWILRETQKNKASFYFLLVIENRYKRTTYIYSFYQKRQF